MMESVFLSFRGNETTRRGSVWYDIYDAGFPVQRPLVQLCCIVFSLLFAPAVMEMELATKSFFSFRNERLVWIVESL